MRILVVNSGSSTLKLRCLDPDDSTVWSRDLPAIPLEGDAEGLPEALSEIEGIDAVGHRVVHGGTRYSAAVVVDQDVERQLYALIDVAPLHQPRSLAALDAVTRALPGVTQVACFDTAFHATLPPEASTYAIPLRWREELGIRRYGFHGLSHAYAARRATEMAQPPVSRIVTCHLGAGTSLAAVRNGICIDTTMGFTPLEGLVMATRSGDVDPGAILWLLRSRGLSADDVADALEHHSGLLGLADTADMREVLDRAGAGVESARLALDVYVHRLCGAVAAMTASLGGLEALVFTGGVGENAPQIRELVAVRLSFLGLSIDADLNRDARPDADISAAKATARCLVIAAREDLEIAHEVRTVLT